ncbi:hypothetical protein RRG08_011217 [Elysia crispata]|uniref:N(4)-(beta-N-acetylglucosaminyl)-L-asparaginase n=1 Tax=Elysia crispata TaxID=231223 RepID=A0AAE0XQK9_9GAST|nr:hypothetical protein RRG08_011217 [Elysia crispata]
MEFRNNFVTLKLIFVFGLIAADVDLHVKTINLPIVVNTWPFTNATQAAWNALQKNLSAADSLVIGCSTCEIEQCDGTVGYGGSPDEHGETTLDAMIMDGGSLAVGAVGSLREIKNAIGVARAVMKYTDHTLLVGDLATEFAVEMGFKRESLSTNRSRQMHLSWKENKCQPNFRKNVVPDPKTSCGPYSPKTTNGPEDRISKGISPDNHDTIGMVVIDSVGNVWAGTSTNGANNKIPGRVGDSPVMGAGSYASNSGGGAAATGDGDIMMRFLPSFRAVLEMERGVAPDVAAKIAMTPIAAHYPDFSGAVVAVDVSGRHGAYCHGFSWFSYSVASSANSTVHVVKVPCHKV